MAIIDRQISERLDGVISDALKKGHLPTSSFVTRALGMFQQRVNGGPIYRPVHVGRGDTFPVASWNRELTEVEFDLNILYKELVAQAIGIMRRTNWAETSYRAQRGQLERLITVLEDLRFTSENSDSAFIGISDSLTDMSKIDLDASTRGVQDLQEESLVIPPTSLGTKRIKMEHMLRKPLQNIEVITPLRTKIYEHGTAPDSPFKHLFQDLSLIWRHDVYTSVDEPVTIQATFNVDEGNVLLPMSRVSVLPHSEGAMKLTVQYSADGISFQNLPGGTDLELRSAKVYTNIDFPTTSISYLRFQITKDTPDDTTGNGNRYTFGLRSIALYKTTRAGEAIYQTLTLTPEQERIEQVALETLEQIPVDTSIDWFIAADTGEFQSIAPLGRVAAYAPRVINFGASARTVLDFLSDTDEIVTVVNAVPIYKIGGPATGDHLFGTGRLWRGRNAWTRDAQFEDQVRTVNDMYLDFRSNDIQGIYEYTTANASSASAYTYQSDSGRTLSETVLTMEDDIYYKPDSYGHMLTPDYGQDPSTDQTPKYAIAKVLAHRPSYSVTREAQTAQLGQLLHLTNRNASDITVEQKMDEGLPTEYYRDMDEGAEIRFDIYDDIPEALNGAWLIQRDSLDGEVLYFTYSILQDVTHLVTRVEGRQIYLREDITADRFEITYRKLVDNVSSDTIAVKNTHSSGPNTVMYTAGVDYTYDPDAKTITRLDGGSIVNAAYIDFNYRLNVLSLDTYRAWCFVDNSDPVRIRFDQINMNSALGERFLLDIAGGQLDLTEAKEIPPLVRGWYRFTVVSESINTSGSAICLVLALKDNTDDTNPVFAGTEYFSEIRAYRTPLRQVTQNQLYYGTRMDNHTKFALDSNGYVLTNFKPGDTSEIVTYVYDQDSDTLVSRGERFELIYSVPATNTPTTLRIRAVLRRNATADPGITPKVHWWAIRIRMKNSEN